MIVGILVAIALAAGQDGPDGFDRAVSDGYEAVAAVYEDVLLGA